MAHFIKKIATILIIPLFIVALFISQSVSSFNANAQSSSSVTIKSASDANGNQVSNGARVSPTTTNGNPNSLTFVVDFSGQHSWTNKDCYIDNQLLSRSDPNNPCADPSWSPYFTPTAEAKTKPLMLSDDLSIGYHSFWIVATEYNTGAVTSNHWNWNSGGPHPGPCPAGQYQNFPGHCIPAPKCQNGQSYDPQAHRCKFLE